MENVARGEKKKKRDERTRDRATRRERGEKGGKRVARWPVLGSKYARRVTGLPR